MAHEPDNVIDHGATPRTDFTGIQSTDQNINGLLSGLKWTDYQLTYGFPDQISDYNSGDYPDYFSHRSTFYRMTGQQIESVDYWLDQYAAVSGLSFTQLTGQSGALNEDQEATLRFANSGDAGTAYAYYPDSHDSGGDIWFDDAGNFPEIGNYDWLTVGHELGHALGLSHGHDGDAGYGPMTYSRDSMEFSIMTYRSYVGASLDGYTNNNNNFAQSLMMYDIAALQFMYGANFNSNATSTTYTWSTATGRMSINGIGQDTPVVNRVFLTIWDGNGSDDHYDLSNYSTNLRLDLNPGAYLDFDTDGSFQRVVLGNSGGSVERARGHVFNALQFEGDKRSLIENATGGSGSDTLIGNVADNELVGNSGNDAMYGQSGDDSLYGGAGRDILSGDAGSDKLKGGKSHDQLFGGRSDDRLFGNLGNDRMDGGKGADYLEGDEGNDVLYGLGGDDILKGGKDKDIMEGGVGNDIMTGGSGNDQFIFANRFGTDIITDFNTNSDAEYIDLVAVTEIDDFADLMANHATQDGAHVVITVNSNTLTLNRTALDDLSDGDFLFA